MIIVNYKAFKAIFIFLIIVLFILATFFFVKGLTMEQNDETSTIYSSSSKIDITTIINDIKSNNSELIYENNNIKEFISLAFKEENKIKTYIIDTYTGELLNFKDIIKENKMAEFEKKEEELLNLKYPKFIIDGINLGEGEKVYLIKENELVIYYYNYNYEYEYNETVFLTINYNEIHNCLNFTHVLDKDYSNEDGYNYQSDKKTVAITFDDGPSSKYNSQFLEVLADNKAHATFFMVGTMMNNCQKCVLDTYNSGNEIGSHTYNHINIKNKSVSEVDENIKKTDELYYQITGKHITYVRPPYGAYDKENLENIKYPLILWNMDPEDWRIHDVNKIVDYIIENVSDGSIILMHELYESSLEALKIVLPKLYTMGYQVVSISELAELQNKTLEVNHAYRSIN